MRKDIKSSTNASYNLWIAVPKNSPRMGQKNRYDPTKNPTCAHATPTPRPQRSRPLAPNPYGAGSVRRRYQAWRYWLRILKNPTTARNVVMSRLVSPSRLNMYSDPRDGARDVAPSTAVVSPQRTWVNPNWRTALKYAQIAGIPHGCAPGAVGNHCKSAILFAIFHCCA